MSAVKNLIEDIEQLLDLGHQPYEVAFMLEIPVSFVYEVEEGAHRDSTD